MNTSSVNKWFVVFTAGVFVLRLAPYLIQDGMFFDGTTYAAISHNMAQGLGSFWQPHFSVPSYPHFHEHPPLAFVIQSWFFQLLGSSIYVERIHSFVMACLSVWLIAVIWRNTAGTNHKQLYWLPVLLFILTPVIGWCYTNNMLENTLIVFTLAATYCIIKAMHSGNRTQWIWLCCSAAAIWAGWLSKGFPALFPIAIPFLHWLIVRGSGFGKMLWQSVLIVVFLVVMVVSTFLLFPDSLASISEYINTQVIQSLSGERVVGHRMLPILQQLFNFLKLSNGGGGVVHRTLIAEQWLIESLPSLGVLLAVWLISRRALPRMISQSQHRGFALFFLAVSLSASLPITISPKQLRFYVAPSIPYICIAAALMIAPVVAEWRQKINVHTWQFKTWRGFVVAVMVFSVLLTAANAGKTRLNHDMLQDVHLIGSLLPLHSIVSVSESVSKDWSTKAYLSRLYHIGLSHTDNKQTYFLLRNNEFFAPPAGYTEIPMGLKLYKLYKKNEKTY